MMSVYLITNMLIGQGLWAKTYGGTDREWAYSVIQTLDNGFAVVGYTYSFSVAYDDVSILKLNTDGSVSWAKSYGSASSEGAYSIIQTSDGGFAIAGYTGLGGAYAIVLKLDPNGSLVWAKRYGGVGSGDWAHSILQTSDGGFVVTGATAGFGPESLRCLILRLDPDGSVSWAKTFGTPTKHDQGYCVVQTSDGGFAVAGYTRSYGAGNEDIFVLKLTSDGSLVWAKTYGGNSSDVAYSIIQTLDGGFIVVGSTYSFGLGGDLFVLKLNSDGSLAWARTYGGTSPDVARSAIRTVDGELLAAGITYSFGVNGDLFVLKINLDGSLDWAKRYGGTNHDRLLSVIQTKEDEFALAGLTASFGAGSDDFIVLKLDPNGSYPGCVQDCNPTVTEFNPIISSPPPSAIADFTPSVLPYSLSQTNFIPVTNDLCSPLAIQESKSRVSIVSSPTSGGLLFISENDDVPIKVYSADGSLLYLGRLMKGRTIVALKPGVYLWKAGLVDGQAVIR